MNILFVIQPTDKSHLRQYVLIMEIFRKQGFHADVVGLKNYNKLRTAGPSAKVYHNLSETGKTNYDMVIAFNNEALLFVSDFVEKNNLPLLYITNEADLPMQYPVNLSVVFQVVLLQQSEIKVDLPLPVKLFQRVRLFSCLCSKQKRSKPINRKFKQILVGVSQVESTRLEVTALVPLLNMLSGFQIVLLLDGTDFTPVISSRIKLLNARKVSLRKHIETADIVIGNGVIIMEAIQHFKPCIIVGERGFGGTLEPEIFKTRFKNGFLGRVGGYPGEFIPERVLLDSLKDIVEWDAEKRNAVTSQNFELLVKEKEAADQKLVQTIHQVVSSHKMLTNNLLHLNLKFSGVFALRLLPNKKFLLVNNILRREEAFFDEDEFKIIKSFGQGCNVADILKKSDYAGEPETFLQFVKELVNEKILEVNEQG